MSLDKSQLATTSIENFDYQNLSSKIDSPRTIEASIRLGIELKELYYVDFAQFKKDNPDIFALPREIQNLRWEHANRTKRNLIQEIKEERERITRNNETLEFSQMDPKSVTNNNLNLNKRFNQINRVNFRSSSQDLRSRSTFSKKNTSTIKLNVSSTFSNNLSKRSGFLDEELKLIEKMKAKHTQEAHNLIEYEIKQQILRREHEERLLLEKQDEERNKKDAIRRQKLRDLEERKRQLIKNQQELASSINKEQMDPDKMSAINDENYYKESDGLNENNNNYNCNINEIKDNNNNVNNDENKGEINQNLSNNNNNNDAEKKENSPNNADSKGEAKAEALELIEQSLKQIIDEINRIHEEELEESLKRKQIARREAESKRKQEEHKQNCEKAYAEERRRALERKKQMELREKERLELMEKSRIKKIKENEKLKKMHQIRLKKTQSQMEEKLKSKFDFFKKKQLMSEEKRNQLDGLRALALKKKILVHSQKQEEIQKNMEKQKEEDEIKLFEFQKKMEEIEKNKKTADEKRDEEIKNKVYELKLKSLKSRESRNSLGKQDEKKTENVVSRIEQYYLKSQKKKEEKERQNMYKSERNSMKRSQIELKFKRIENVKEIERVMEREKIEEKNKTLEEFHDNRLLVANKKRVLAIEIANQRKMTLEKLQDFMNKNKEITPEMIKKLFPQDVKLLEKIQAIQESSQMNKSIYRSTSHVCNASLKKFSNKTVNDSIKYRTNMSLRSSDFAASSSKVMSKTKGFSLSSFSNFNQFNRSAYLKPLLEPLSEKNMDGSCRDFNEEAQEELFKTKINNSNKNDLKNNEKEKSSQSAYDKYFSFNVNNNNNNLINNSNSNFNFPQHNRYNSVTKFDSRNNVNNVNFYGTRSSFNKMKQGNKHFLSLKTPEPKTSVNCNKSLGNSQMPIISGSSNSNSTKNKIGKIISNDNNNKNKNLYNFNAVFDDKVKKKIIEKDIEKKIESYKIKLNSDMLKVLKDEKKREEEREIHYNKATSELEKRRLESLIALERVQSSEKIIRLNEGNEKKLKEYEDKLRLRLRDLTDA